MLSSRQKLIKKMLLPLALVVFIGLFVTDIFFVPSAGSSTLHPVRNSLEIIAEYNQTTAESRGIISNGVKFMSPQPSRISDDLGPRIDSEAASIIKEDNEIIPLCSTLPGEMWILLLAAYVFLMFFNLFYDFERATELRWFWEGLYTALALWGWYVWDSCHQNLWFPLYVLKLGTIVYLVYLYLYYRKKEIQPFSEEDLENFEA